MYIWGRGCKISILWGGDFQSLLSPLAPFGQLVENPRTGRRLAFRIIPSDSSPQPREADLFAPEGAAEFR